MYFEILFFLPILCQIPSFEYRWTKTLVNLTTAVFGVDFYY